MTPKTPKNKPISSDLDKIISPKTLKIKSNHENIDNKVIGCIKG